MSALAGLPGASARAAEQIIFYVNTAEAGAKDANTADAKCETETSGKCSLRAAIEQANAIAETDAEILITLEEGFSGTISMPNQGALRMQATAGVTDADRYGAYFHVTRTVTIDLLNNLGVLPKEDDSSCAFWIEAENTKLLNFTNVGAGETSIVFGPDSDGSLLDGGEFIQTENYYSERLVYILPGADGVTIRNYKVGRLYNAEQTSGAITIRDSSLAANTSVKDVTISKVTIDNTPVGGSTLCSGQTGQGCATIGIAVSGLAVNNLVIESSQFTHFPYIVDLYKRRVIDLSKALASSDIDIRYNTFTDIRSDSGDLTDATIVLPANRQLSGANWVRHNTFDNAASPNSQAAAIYWDGKAATAGQASNLRIEDNHFDGYATAGVALANAGVVTMRRNTFGAASASATGDAIAEETGAASGASHLVVNNDATTNHRIITWYPQQPKVTGACELQVQVVQQTAPSGYQVPTAPVALDFYYTAGRTAEVYLGSVENVAPDQSGLATVTVPELPPAEGGKLRLQTQGSASEAGQLESSHYSRVVDVPTLGQCLTPRLDFDLRAWENVSIDEAKEGHDAIVSGGDLVESGASVSSGEEIWFTYTAANTGYVTLRNVTVTDSLGGPVCVIPQLPKLTSAGCVQRYTAP
ncbi:MAG: hypothetical protein LBD51_06620 [Bifidobacteriaceae bacterium]|nr:hypothetical protein [Bifidobacteriaceae bacterium]